MHVNKQKIIVTGVTGFIGKHLAYFLQKIYPRIEIIGIVRSYSNSSESFECYVLDLTDEYLVCKMINEIKPDYIFHLAGLVFSYDLNALYHANVVSTLNLLSAIKRCKLNTRLIVAGSAAEYGSILKEHLPVTEKQCAQPQSPYGMTKLWQTLMTQYEMFDGVDVCVGRIFNVIGPHISEHLTTGQLLGQLERVRNKQQEPKLYVGNLTLKRDFLDIEDVCSALIALALKGKSREIYNICSGSSLSFNELLDVYLSAYPLNLEVVVDPKQAQNSYIQDIYGCNEKLKRDTGWIPLVNINDSIVKWSDARDSRG